MIKIEITPTSDQKLAMGINNKTEQDIANAGIQFICDSLNHEEVMAKQKLAYPKTIAQLQS